ncbi:MAG TPA: hypothetical protein VJC18_05425, partial [bacterium]|nr:hypothetical protein [bacterium]
MLQAVLLQKKSRSPLIENLENDFAFTRVNNVAALKKQLFKKEFDFVFIAEKDVLQLMQSVLTVYELDKELPIIAHDSPEIYNKIP